MRPFEQLTVLQSLEATRVHAIPELVGRPDALEVIDALIAGGIRCIEILLPGQRGIELFSEIVSVFGAQAHIGAGSVVDSAFAQTVLERGAAMVVTPVVFPEVVRFVAASGRVMLCGAMTPTECVQATHAGANMVKLFPANAFSHAALRTMLVPLPDLRIVAAGGISASNAAQYIRAGARAVAAGYYLVGSREKPLPYATIVERSRLLLDAVAKAEADSE